jgi:hypothetical protein
MQKKKGPRRGTLASINCRLVRLGYRPNLIDSFIKGNEVVVGTFPHRLAGDNISISVVHTLLQSLSANIRLHFSSNN